MNELRTVIAENICALRTESGMTQAQLASVLSYTDKAISKWERGDSIPDVIVLKQIADCFGVTVDYLLRKSHTSEEERLRDISRLRSRNHLMITLICAVSVWVLATVIFVTLLATGASAHPIWLIYVYSVPVSSIVLLVFNSIWGRRRLNFIIVSVLLWSLLVSVYLSVLSLVGDNLWFAFLVGIPAQILLSFIPGLTVIKKRKRSSEL